MHRCYLRYNEGIDMKKFAIHIAGPSCSGKTTFSNALGERFPDLYIISFDKLKWQLAGYHRDKHSALIKDIELGVFEVICKKEIPLTLDFFCAHAREYAACQSIAKTYGYAFLSIQLTAPTEVLLERFRKRAQKAKEIGSKVTITDEKMFFELLDKKAYVPPGTPVFDTSVTSTAEIVDATIAALEQA